MPKRSVLPLGALLFAALWLPGWAAGQVQQDQPLVERLGFPPETRVLIVHADDLGLCGSVNRAVFAALEAQRVTSASIMVPCPWTPQVAAEAASHPEWDLGIHLTMNAEWKPFKWRPVTPDGRVRTLVDSLGFLHETLEESVRTIDPAEAEIEVRSQIEQMKAFGVEPTHLDSHMGTLLRTPQLLAMILRVAREYRLPLMVPGNMLFMAPFAKELITEQDVVLDSMLSMYPGSPVAKPESWSQGYREMLTGLKPGVHQLVVHLGFDDPELQAITAGHPEFGAAWRQRDLDFIMSDDFASLIEEEDIRLLTWREVGRRLR